MATNKQPTKPKENASGIPVHCSFDKLLDITQLVPNPRNPNKHPEKQIALLAKVIRHQGWRAPIVVSNRSGFVVAGHGRLEAAKVLQVELAPVDFQDFATEADEHAHLVADNRLAELAEIDEKELAAILSELKTQDLDMDLTGFDADSLGELDLSSLTGQEEKYTNKIIAPIYEPKGEKPKVSELYDSEKTKQLLGEIESAGLPEEVAGFLRAAAERHTVFHFRNIAEFYAHSPKQIQDLMERSGLVIIDYNKAIEFGFVHLTERLCEIADVEGVSHD